MGTLPFLISIGNALSLTKGSGVTVFVYKITLRTLCSTESKSGICQNLIIVYTNNNIYSLVFSILTGVAIVT